jgi:predicted kinase
VTPTLYIFSGLPAVGKTTLARQLAAHLKSVYLRIDTIEQALREVCGIDVQGEGYDLAYRLASTNLKMGLSVIADSCNPIQRTRDEWDRTALNASATSVNIEIICSNEEENRTRVECRQPTITGLKLPSWDEVLHRDYDAWTRERIVIDTSGRTEDQSFGELLSRLSIKDAAPGNLA